MITRRGFLLAAALCTGICGSAFGGNIDRQALQLFDKVGSYLTKSPAFSFRAKIAISDTRPGFTNTYDTEVVFRRPVQFSITFKNPETGDVEIQAVCDGKELGSYRKNINGYTLQPAPATIGKFWMAGRDPAIEPMLPFLMEFMRPDPMQFWIHNPYSAKLLGVDTSRGIPRQHARCTLQARGVFRYHSFELWADEYEEGVVPVRLIISRPPEGDCNYGEVYKDFTAQFDFVDWNTNPTLTDQTFVFNAPAGAKQIK